MALCWTIYPRYLNQVKDTNNMLLLDKHIFKGILHITCEILQKHFFYSADCLGRFISYFTKTVGINYTEFTHNTPYCVLNELAYNPVSREEFSLHFLSHHLREIMIDFLFFSEEELILFENFLPKFEGEH